MLVQCSILELTLLHCHALESRSYVWALDYDAKSVTAVTLVNKILDGQFESDMNCKLVCLHKKSIVEKTRLRYFLSFLELFQIANIKGKISKELFKEIWVTIGSMVSFAKSLLFAEEKVLAKS